MNIEFHMQQTLLHTCCAPCSAPIIEWLLQNDIQPVLFFFNPNIFPQEEYIRRKEESIRFAAKLGLEFIDGDYDHEAWLRRIAGLEDEPERGKRCMSCFKIRLEATALLAADKGIPTFTTTLTGSRWKNYNQIVEAGMLAESKTTGTRFWDRDWKKGGLTERRKFLLLENDFYNQQYCGCEFSMRKA